MGGLCVLGSLRQINVVLTVHGRGGGGGAWGRPGVRWCQQGRVRSELGSHRTWLMFRKGLGSKEPASPQLCLGRHQGWAPGQHRDVGQLPSESDASFLERLGGNSTATKMSHPSEGQPVPGSPRGPPPPSLQGWKCPDPSVGPAPGQATAQVPLSSLAQALLPSSGPPAPGLLHLPQPPVASPGCPLPRGLAAGHCEHHASAQDPFQAAPHQALGEPQVPPMRAGAEVTTWGRGNSVRGAGKSKACWGCEWRARPRPAAPTMEQRGHLESHGGRAKRLSLRRQL